MNAAAGNATGTVLAAGFVLDVPLIGAPEAVERVLELWCEGARLHELPDGRWLLVLPDPVRTRADRAPGVPLERAGRGALAAVGTGSDPAAEDGRLVLRHGELTVSHALRELPSQDPSDWLLLTGLTLHRPRPLGVAPVPAATPVEDSVPPAAGPDLRAAAGIRPTSERARRLTAEAPSGGEPAPDDGARSRRSRRRRSARSSALDNRAATVLVVLVMFVPLLFVVLYGLGVFADRGFDPAGVVYASIAGGIAYALLFGRSAAGNGSGSGNGKRSGNGRGSGNGGTAETAAAAASGRPAPGRTRRPWLGDVLARLTLRTPAAHLLHDRHVRYLRELTRAFEQHRWEDALRDAVPLAVRQQDGRTAPRTWLTLALPKRFAGQLRPTPHRVGPAVASAFGGGSVHQHLTELYRHAAERLERQERFDEAAFVLADLLNAPAEAAALLDRHGRSAQAAELAEGRNLAADLVVRLWWRAGERERAVRTAHRRGVFATAVERLADTDPQAARGLRVAWAEHCRAAGDRLGAVDAAWPDEALRPMVAADLRDAVALGGPTRGRALPYLLALGAGDATRALARAVLDGDGDPATTGRSALAATLAGLPAADAATDRELATAAARAVVRDGGFGTHGGPAEHPMFDRLLNRADPLTAADLPRPRPVPPPRGTAPVHTAADRPGTLPVLDAALLASGSVLVACGQAGARLLGPDGRTRAHWDTPTDRFVLADHGGSALLVADHGPDLSELSHLDLATRTVRPWTTLRARHLAPSYDGRHLIASADGGIVVLDTLAPRPTAVWRELGGEHRLLGGITRTPGGCAAIVRTPSTPRSWLTEVWRWDLPGWELRGRLRVDDALTDLLERTDPADLPDPVALAAGGLLTAEPAAAAGDPSPGDSAPDRTVLRWTSDLPAAELSLDGRAPSGPATDGDHWALTVPTPDGTGLRGYAGTGPCSAPALTVHVPNASGERIEVRRHAGAVTYRHRSGRVLATSADGGTLLANLRVTVR